MYKPKQKATLWKRTQLLLLSASLATAGAATAGEPTASSTTGSRAASELFGEGSVLIASGTAELLSTGGDLVVASVQTSARGVRLVLRPVTEGLSATAEFSAAVTVELSQSAWEAASAAARAAGRGVHASAAMVGDVVETMVVSTAIAGSAAGTSVVGTALVIGKIVVGIVPGPGLDALLGHGVHECEIHS